MEEKLFPISINPDLCKRCQKCSYSCPPKAIFWRDSMRYVDYNKCEGCLKCVSVCEHGANEVISIKDGKLQGFTVDEERCSLCLRCVEDFCFQNRYLFDEKENKIVFNDRDLSSCFNCLKCFKNCPNNAIIPQIQEK
jgi:ferredoxin